MSGSHDLGHIPFVTWVTWREPIVEQNMLNLSYIEAPEILLVVFGGVHVAEALVSCVMFYILLFAFSSFVFWSFYYQYFDVRPCVVWIILQLIINRIGGVMVNVLASSAVDRRFKPRSGETKDYELLYVASPISTQH